MVVMNALKKCISICVCLFALSLLFGCTSSDIDIFGTWVVDLNPDTHIVITNNEMTIGDYAHAIILKYDNVNAYAVVFFDKHTITEEMIQTYVKVSWRRLSETSVILDLSYPHGSAELAVDDTLVMESAALVRVSE
ncbi:MAG: hypothetical protein ACXADW_22165 [Candidatus Hodarchaeales archaeon]|jgi:hypothetical protein